MFCQRGAARFVVLCKVPLAHPMAKPYAPLVGSATSCPDTCGGSCDTTPLPTRKNCIGRFGLITILLWPLVTGTFCQMGAARFVVLCNVPLAHQMAKPFAPMVGPAASCMNNCGVSGASCPTAAPS